MYDLLLKFDSMIIYMELNQNNNYNNNGDDHSNDYNCRYVVLSKIPEFMKWMIYKNILIIEKSSNIKLFKRKHVKKWMVC